jgi:hypothetical protein
MQRQVPCPKCGALCYVTDAQCLSCGIALDEGRAANLAELPPPPPQPQATPAVPDDDDRPRMPLGLALSLIVFYLSIPYLAHQGHVCARDISTSEPTGLVAIVIIYGQVALSLLIVGLSLSVWSRAKWARFATGQALIANLLALLMVTKAVPMLGEQPLVGAVGLVATLLPLIALILPSAGRYCSD